MAIEWRTVLETAKKEAAMLRKPASEDPREAERAYRALATDHQAGEVRPEALYWAGVSKYRGGDQGALGETARLFREMFPESNCARKSSVWG